MNCWGGQAFATAPVGWSGTADEPSAAVAPAAAAKAPALRKAALPAATRVVPSFQALLEEASQESCAIPWDRARGGARSQYDPYPTRCWYSAAEWASASPAAGPGR